MSIYPVTSISLAPVPGIHSGTGTFGITEPFVVPPSVPPPGQLQFTSQTADVTTMLFAIAENVVPNWFGVAVPSGITELGNVNIFFHPTPAQAGYLDTDYVSKSRQWPDLFYYMERLGFQLDAATRNQVIIMPFLTETAKDTGIFPGNWQEIVADILSGVQTAITGTSGSPVAIQAVAVSSFSAGIVYSDSFRTHASGLSAVLTEVWDLDGNFSTYRSISQNLRATAGCRVIQYDQVTSNDSLSFHVPLPRWSNCTPAPTTPGSVHSLIRDFMFTHGASISGVGGPIASVGAPTATITQLGTLTATHTGTAMDTGASPRVPVAPGIPAATGVSAAPVTPGAPGLPAMPVTPAIPGLPDVPAMAGPQYPQVALPASPSAPASSPCTPPAPQPGASKQPVTVDQLHACSAVAGCACCRGAVVGVVTAASATATTAITAITAIAGMPPRR